jgi:diacylglycerol kinase family enzyme
VSEVLEVTGAPVVATGAETAKRARVVVNARAGTVHQAGEAQFSEEITARFAEHGITAEIDFSTGDVLRQRLEAALAADTDHDDTIVVLAGGDGTISLLLPVIIAAQRPVGILPLGTMNLLGRDLGLTGEIAHDIGVIAAQQPRSVTLARINGTPFHSNSGFGILGVMAREREAARSKFPLSRQLSFAWAATRTLMLSRSIVVELEIDGQRENRRTDALLITSNRFHGMPWQRARLDEGVLELHALRAPNILKRIGMLVAVLRGRWREHPALTTVTTKSATIKRRDKKRSTVAIDGEMRRMTGPIRYDLAPETVRLYGKPPVLAG